MTAPWTRALVFCVAGVEASDPETAVPDVALARRRIQETGVDLRAHVASRRAAELPWPAPLPPSLRAALPSLAQFYAAQAQLVDELDVVASQPKATRPLTPDEQRLISDRPPHFGSVG